MYVYVHICLKRVLRMTKCCGIWMTRVLEPELLRSGLLPLLQPFMRQESGCQVRCINGYRVAVGSSEPRSSCRVEWGFVLGRFLFRSAAKDRILQLVPNQDAFRETLRFVLGSVLYGPFGEPRNPRSLNSTEQLQHLLLNTAWGTRHGSHKARSCAKEPRDQETARP